MILEGIFHNHPIIIPSSKSIETSIGKSVSIGRNFVATWHENHRKKKQTSRNLLALESWTLHLTNTENTSHLRIIRVTRPGKHTKSYCLNGHRKFVDLPIKIAWWIFPVRYVTNYQAGYGCWIQEIRIKQATST